MIIGLWVFRRGFHGLSYQWWMLAFWIQFWHHIEHALLQTQAIVGHNLLGSPVPVSIVQLWVPRVELHLFYNTIVFIPMMLGMYFHMFPPKGEEPSRGCSCAWHKGALGIYQNMAEDHTYKGVGECHPYREFEGMQPSRSMQTSLASATGVSPWVSTPPEVRMRHGETGKRGSALL
jgi:hypothetical protein